MMPPRQMAGYVCPGIFAKQEFNASYKTYHRTLVPVSVVL
jgi:hypothetical protein